METYTTKEFIYFIQIINCMPFDQFKQMYEKIFEYVSERYAQENFDLMCSEFESWICSIDYSNLEKMMNICLKK